MSRWPITDQLPGNVTVTVYFVGLMAFCYNTKKQCEVGFFDTDQHSLSVAVYRNYENRIFLKQHIKSETGLKLFIQEKEQRPRVRFFHGDDFDKETRTSGDSNDFRWLIDLETYGHELPKHNYECLGARLFVSHGTFFTFLPTLSTFTDKESKLIPFGHIARVVAANIQLRKDETLILRVPGESQPDPISAKPGITYQIVFNNECKGDQCNESDFEKIFALLDAPPFNLHPYQDNSAGAPKNPIPLPKHAEVRVRSNDATPCMGASFGETGGFHR